MKRFLSFWVLALFLVSCSEVLVKPTLAEFKADKTSITLGENVTLTWSGASSGASLSLSPGFIDVTGLTSYKVTPEQTTTYTLQITNSAGANSYTAVVTVLPANEAPKTQNLTLNMLANKVLAIKLAADDADNDALRYELVTQPSKGALSELNASTGELNYTPNKDFSGTDSFTYKANDGREDSSVATVSITVKPNTPPTANAQTLSTAKNTALDIVLTGNSPQNASLTYALEQLPKSGSTSNFNTATGELSYEPKTDFVGTDSFTFTVSDGTLSSATTTVNITITDSNAQPVATAQSLTVNEDTDLSITLTGTDEESSSLSYTVLTNPSNGSLFGTVPTLTYRPSPNYFGDDSFSFKVNDGELDSDTATISITVDAVNDLPTADAQSLSTDKNTNLNITLTGNDLESSSLTYAIVTNPSHGLLSGSGANRSYTPNTNFTGADSFMFKVNDGTDDSEAVKVSITILSPSAPRITSFRSTKTLVNAGETVTFSWAINSADGDAVRCTLDVGGGTTYAISDCVNTTSQTHTYSSAGFFTANLIASDDDGSATSDNINMTVAESSSSDFSIQIVFVDRNLTMTQKAAFTNAAARWTEIITGDLADISSGTWSCNDYPEYEFTGTIDDIVIMAAAPALDGTGGTLGSAGPCGLRSGPLPTYGLMRFDIADIANLETNGGLEDLILHEMGHVLGIGTIWNFSGNNFIDTVNHSYSGTQAVDEYSVLKGSTQTTVPIEDSGGVGTINAHWEEDIFDTELMTGFLNLGVLNPISSITLGSLEDLGYTVDYSQADAYSLPSGSSLQLLEKKIHLHSEPILPNKLEPESGN